MNIDDEIKKLELIKEGHLEIIKSHKTKVNEIALTVRRLQTVKKHAAALITEAVTKPASKEEALDMPFIDPAQLDIDDDLSAVERTLTAAPMPEVLQVVETEAERPKKRPRPQEAPAASPQGNEEEETKDLQAENDLSEY